MNDLIQSDMAQTTPCEVSKKKKREKFFENNKAYLYLAPALVALAIFTIYPIFNTVISAFKNGYNPLNVSNPYDGFGVQNFVKVFQYPKFTIALTNTLLFAFISVPISTLLALFISVWLNQIKWIQKAYQTIFFLPYLTNALAIGAVFAAMFNIVGDVNPTSFGFVNSVLMPMFGLKEPINWINAGSNIWLNRMVVILYSIWSALPFKILILFSSLQSVNKQYYNAAKIDGASRSRTLWKVTVPLISPMLSYLIVTGFIGGFKEYTSVVGIFGPTMGAPGAAGDMNTMVGFIYDCINESKIGLASAGALVLFGIILVFTFINLYVSKKRVHY